MNKKLSEYDFGGREPVTDAQGRTFMAILGEEDPERVQIKRCARCGEWKPADAFSIARSAPDGLQSYCRDCQKEWYEKRKVIEKVKAKTNLVQGCDRCEIEPVCRFVPETMAYLQELHYMEPPEHITVMTKCDFFRLKERKQR